MRNFEKRIEDASDEDLRHWIDNYDPNYTVLASDELTRRNLKGLEESINNNTKEISGLVDITDKFNTEASSQTEKMVNLTRIITVLTVVLVLGLVVQIYLARIQTRPILYEQGKNEKRAYDYCKLSPEGTWPNAYGEPMECKDVLKMIGNKFE